MEYAIFQARAINEFRIKELSLCYDVDAPYRHTSSSFAAPSARRKRARCPLDRRLSELAVCRRSRFSIWWKPNGAKASGPFSFGERMHGAVRSARIVRTIEQDGESMHGRDNGRLGESEPSVLDVRRGEIHAKANR
jgi:hypothetical protein